MKKCVIVYNAKSGKLKSEKFINTFYNVIENNGYELEVITTKCKGDATNIVKNLPDDIDLVIAAGGDGTFNEAIKGNVERKKKLLMSHLPIGTTNDVGTMYGFSKNSVKDLHMILNGKKKNIDLIMLNGTPFIYVAAFGNFINVTFDTPKKLKETFGKVGYILYGFSEIAEKIKLHHLKLNIDGVEKEGDYSFIFITNSSRIGGINDIYRDVKLDDNKFEVLLCHMTNKAKIVKSLLYVFNNGVDENVEGCDYYSASTLDIEFDDVPDFSWGLDGEEYKSTTNKFSFTINKDIDLLLPENNIEKLFVK